MTPIAHYAQQDWRHWLSVLTPEEIDEVQTTAAVFLRMSQAFFIHGGRTMSVVHLGARHLWLGLSFLKEQKQRRILGLPLSTSSLF